ncbi:hypothetical protein K431DRAFT_233493 [Polychaeton citri CBS 116435]|uniref:RBR-type E3 ubiquitin transferase n=1 Tax=Polychaeton citri CBS 116435 TaxID=1314669 RepID=A0A9P4Q0T5_9PEZI|nr:hypothetical protein K431DRAFT_233493 [Polychaeton citri CBS 116435]
MRIPLYQCHTCFGQFPPDEISTLPCNHLYCDGCLNSLFAATLKDETLYPPRCCRQPIPFDSVRLFLNGQLAAQFANKKEELDDKDKIYCHVPTCSTYINASHRVCDRATCQACGERTCLVCKGSVHLGDCPKDEEVQSVLTLAREQGWQRCNACGRVVDLRIGCNHITCHCKAEFCYRCGATWRTCTCLLFDEQRLLERAQNVVNRGGRPGGAVAVATMVNHLRDNHECAHDRWERVDEPDCECEECGDVLRDFILQCSQCQVEMCARCVNNRQ